MRTLFSLFRSRRGWLAGMAVAALGAGLASPAAALSYCDAKTPCKTGETCFVQMCVPSASLCKDSSTCASWQSCDLTCKIGGGFGDTMTISTDGGSSSSGGGSSGGSSGGSDPREPPAADAGSTDPEGDVHSPMPELPPPPPCPKDQGLCLADKAKLPKVESCVAACKVLAGCDGMGGGSGSSGGSPGEVPPSPGPEPADGGEGMPQPGPDAGGGGEEPPMPDPGTRKPQPNPAGEAMCVQMCQLVHAVGTTKAEWEALGKCLVDTASAGKTCGEIEKACQAQGEAFGAKMESDPAFEMHMMALIEFGPTSGGPGGGGTGAERNSSGSLASDAGGDTKAASGGSTAAASSSDSGCTAGSASGNVWGLLAPGALAVLWVLGRRRVRSMP